jgi:hypothetical protein
VKEDHLKPFNPALQVQRLPPADIERGYLRLHEIPVYLDSCSELYRPLAETFLAYTTTKEPLRTSSLRPTMGGSHKPANMVVVPQATSGHGYTPCS